MEIVVGPKAPKYILDRVSNRSSAMDGMVAVLEWAIPRRSCRKFAVWALRLDGDGTDGTNNKRNVCCDADRKDNREIAADKHDSPRCKGKDKEHSRATGIDGMGRDGNNRGRYN